VVSALVGYSNRREVLEALQYLDADEADRDYSAVIDKYQGDFKGNCVYCNHCLPCPSGINIAEVNKYFDIAVLDEANIPPGVHAHYKALEKHGADCIFCGSCEERCPFSVPVVKNMEKARTLFGF
jgi:predicted aldo/keto reductase-like oxidoreductase